MKALTQRIHCMTIIMQSNFWKINTMTKKITKKTCLKMIRTQTHQIHQTLMLLRTLFLMQLTWKYYKVQENLISGEREKIDDYLSKKWVAKSHQKNGKGDEFIIIFLFKRKHYIEMAIDNYYCICNASIR